MDDLIRHRHEDLTVVGYSGTVGPRTRPYLLDPLYAVTSSQSILVPPYKDDGSCVIASGIVSRRDLMESVQAGDATLVEPACPARSDGCLYAPVGDGPAIYTTRTHAHKEQVEFALDKRAVGDRHWRARELSAALAAYELAAAISQEADDYARMLLCDVGEARKERLSDWIVLQGKDPSILCDELRDELRRELTASDLMPLRSAMHQQRLVAHKNSVIGHAA